MEQHSKDTKDGAAVTEKPSEHHQAAVPPGGRCADFRECQGSPCHREGAGRERTGPACAERDAESQETKNYILYLSSPTKLSISQSVSTIAQVNNYLKYF